MQILISVKDETVRELIVTDRISEEVEKLKK